MSAPMPNRMTEAAHRRDTPKLSRRLRRARLGLFLTRPMVDPLATLGHPARPRKRATR